VHVEDFTVYVQDIISHVQALKANHPGLPCFLLGHSMVTTSYSDLNGSVMGRKGCAMLHNTKMLYRVYCLNI